MTTLVLQVAVHCRFFFLKPFGYFRNPLTQPEGYSGASYNL